MKSPSKSFALPKRLLFGLVAMCLMSGVLLLLLEAFLWVAMPVSTTPGFSKVLDQEIPGCAPTITYARNDLGLRTATVASTRKSDGAFRVLCLGASTTDDATKDLDASWPRLVELQLQGAFSDTDVEIELAAWGRPGTRISSRLLWLQENLDRYQPDMVVLLEGINDLTWSGGADYCWQGVESVRAGKKDKIKKLVQHSQLGRRVFMAYDAMQVRAMTKSGHSAAWQAELEEQQKGHQARELVAAPERPQDPFVEFSAALDAMLGLLNDRGVGAVVMSQGVLWKPEMTAEEEAALWFSINTPDGLVRASNEWLATEMDRWNQRQEELAYKHQALFIDLDAMVPKDLKHYFDDCHFTIHGSRVAAEVIAPRLQREIERHVLGSESLLVNSRFNPRTQGTTR